MIIFENPGELDSRLITLMGVNVKPESTSPIGFFGTGLKYAIAVTLRLGEEIQIQSGEDLFLFELEEEEIRGKVFETIWMIQQGPNPEPGSRSRLGFTTELGKTWEPWMVYRELWSNAKDEGGYVWEQEDRQKLPPKKPNLTRVIVKGPQLQLAAAKCSSFILETKPFHVSGDIEASYGSSSSIFYRGLKIGELQKPSLFTYNLLSDTELTEDRTIKNPWQFPTHLVHAIALSDSPSFVKSCLNANPGTFEHDLDFSWTTPRNIFLAEAETSFRSHIATMNVSAMKLIKSLRKAEVVPAKLTSVEVLQLSKALSFLKSLGFTISQPIHVTDSLGNNILGCVTNDQIFLSRRAFMAGTKCVAGTILEEWLHLEHNLKDCSRELQNWLLDKVISLGEEVKGEPL